MVDAASKYTHLIPIRRCTSNEICKKLHKLFCETGFVSQIVSDNGKCFTSEVFNHFCWNLGIQHIRISPYRPASNVSERYIGVVKNMLKAYVHDRQIQWARFLPEIQFSLNQAEHSVLKGSPASFYFGRELRDPLSVKWELSEDELNTPDVQAKWEQGLVNVYKHWRQRERKQRELVNSSKVKVNDLVLLKGQWLSSLADKFNAGLMPRWKGPYKITKFLSANTVLLSNCEDPNQALVKAHIENIKPFVSSE